MSTYQVSTPRLLSVASRLRGPARPASAAAAHVAALFCVFGTVTANTPENQRGAALLQYLLHAEQSRPASEVAALITPAESLFIYDSSSAAGGGGGAVVQLSDVKPEGHAIRAVTLAEAPAAVAELLSRLAADDPSALVGAPLREFTHQEGPFAAAVAPLVPPARCVEASAIIGELLFHKDARAAAAVAAAGQLCMQLFTHYARPLVLEPAIATHGRPTLGELQASLCKGLADPPSVAAGRFARCGAADGYAPAPGIPPLVAQAGDGSYREPVQVSAEELSALGAARLSASPAVVHVRYALKRYGYTALLARTLLVLPHAPSPAAAAAYSFCLAVSDRVVSLLVPGAVLRDVHAAAMAFAKERDAALAARLSPTLGFTTGLLVLEKRGAISADGIAVVEDDMTFVVRVVLQSVPCGDNNSNSNSNKELTSFDIELADTVVVQGGAATVVTAKSRATEEVTLYDEEDDDNNNSSDADAAAAGGGGSGGSEGRKLTVMTRSRIAGAAGASLPTSKEYDREERLKVLLKELNEELQAAGGKRAAGADGSAAAAAMDEYKHCDIGRLALGEPLSAAAAAGAPPAEVLARAPSSSSNNNNNGSAPQMVGNALAVQEAAKLIWVPVHGRAACFHISTVAKVDVRSEGAGHYACVITFHAQQEANLAFRVNRTRAFVKELRYEATSDAVFNHFQAAVAAVQQRIKNDDAARRRQAMAAAAGGGGGADGADGGNVNARLQLVGNPVSLQHLRARPPLAAAAGGRQRANAAAAAGNLELHGRGLRYTMLGAAPVVMLFDNIAHTIFQPCTARSSMAIFHVTLKRPVEVGKKSIQELQFFAEVTESSAAVTGARQSFEQEMHEEAAVKQRRDRTNQQFAEFVRKVNDAQRARTHIGSERFSFEGAHARGQVQFYGDAQVLWSIADWPPLTLRVAEVEVVALERVQPGLSTFDITFVFKDYNRKVVQLRAVPSKQLDVVKDWCLHARLYYITTTVNVAWPGILKTILKQDDWNPWDARDGWNSMSADAPSGDDDEEDEEDSDDDSDETASFSEEDEESDSEDSDSSWEADEESEDEDDDDSEEEDEEDDDDDSEADWDELERDAEEDDRRHSRAESGKGGKSSSGSGGAGQKRPRPASGSSASAAPGRPMQLPRTKGVPPPPPSGGFAGAPPAPRRF